MADNASTPTAPENSLMASVERIGDDIVTARDDRNAADANVARAQTALNEAKAVLEQKQARFDELVMQRSQFDRAAHLLSQHRDVLLG